MIYIRSTQHGFTIVETLVAITVLMLAIAGPLVVASKGLFGADVAKDQMIASYLAQESMEAIKNTRDNGIYNGTSWFNTLGGCSKANPCDASALDGISNNPSITSCGGVACRIYSEANGYGHVASGGTQTKFTREFYLHSTAESSMCSSTTECGVAVEVYWNEGTIPYSYILNGEITFFLR